MIKKKKEQHNQNRQIKGAAGYNTYEKTVRRNYLLCLREVKNRPKIDCVYESVDYDHARMKWRMEATLESLLPVESYPILPERCIFCCIDIRSFFGKPSAELLPIERG